MRLEFEPNSSALPFVENEVVSQDVTSEVERMLREGVRAAQEGKRAEARSLLLRVTEADAESENAWLWLASISEYPEELLVFLNNVLKVNPHNLRALEWHRATKSLLAKTLVQRGIEAINDNRRDFARQCFEQALEHGSENEMAWLWMASVADSEDEKAAYFEKVLSLNAANETALASLQAIRSLKTQRLYQEALAAAFDGRHANALELLESVFSQDAEMEDAWILRSHLAASFEERAECFLKIRVLNPENEMAKACLASWRMLSEKLAAQPEAEAAPGSNPVESNEASFEDLNAVPSNVEPAAEWTEPSNEPVYHVEVEQPAAEAAVETEAETAGLETEAAAGYFDATDAPTQDLSLDSGFAAPGEAEPVAEEENNYEEFHAEEVKFETEESGDALPEPAADLKAALEAEEAEMNWAFNYPPNKQEAEDYFRNAGEDDDIHKTQQANYDEDYFSQEGFGAAEQPAEEPAETDAEAAPHSFHEEDAEAEWRDTSPSVFVNYAPAAPEDVFETPVVESAAAEMPVAERLTEFDAEAEMSAPQMSFEESASEQAAEAPVEVEAAPVEVQAFEMHAEEVPLPPQMEEKPAAPRAETVLCPFCDAVNEKQAFSCGACHTVLTLSDLEMLLAANAVNHDQLLQSVESLERENEAFGLNPEQLTNLGVGHVNLKNYRQGFLYLQEAVRKNPSNVLLDAQVNALAIRLSEMEEQQSAHDAMPKNRKILVVDDSPTVRKLISGKLEKCGHEVICAVDGVDALEKINELVPDLVLLDITMPRMDGYQVCKLIRNNETTKDVPVVMISGKDGFFDKVRGRMAGTSGYITKPFGPETLMKTVETYLN